MLISSAVLACGMLAAAGPQARVSVINTLDQARPEEVVEIPLREALARVRGAKAEALVVREAAGGRTLPTQLYSSTGAGAPDLLLVLAGLPPKGSLDLVIEAGSAAAPVRPLVFGRFVPERQDDFAWENDKIAFRMYGPALQKTGEISSGVDVWVKRVPDLVIDEWYRKDLESARRRDNAFSYHRDYGQGLDSYTVGPTLGCGGTAIWDGSKIIRSRNYAAWKVLASGPLRFSFELAYEPWEAGGVQVSETKRITLDAGSHLNRMESTFHAAGAGRLAAVAGVVMHPGASLNVAPDASFLSVWEPADDKTAGMIATGIVLAPGADAETKQAGGHALFVFEARPGRPLRYYAGAGWSKSDIADQRAWNRYLAGFAARLKSPLQVRWK
jgi:pectinesterase